jgi:hypothetical protein
VIHQTYSAARTITIAATTATKPNCSGKLLANPWPLLSLCVVMGDDLRSGRHL